MLGLSSFIGSLRLSRTLGGSVNREKRGVSFVGGKRRGTSRDGNLTVTTLKTQKRNVHIINQKTKKKKCTSK